MGLTQIMSDENGVHVDADALNSIEVYCGDASESLEKISSQAIKEIRITIDHSGENNHQIVAVDNQGKLWDVATKVFNAKTALRDQMTTDFEDLVEERLGLASAV